MGLEKISLVNLVKDWNSCHGAFYALRESDFFWHLEKQDWLDYSLEYLAGVPALVAVASAEGQSQGVSGKSVWLSLHGKIPLGGEKNFAEAMDSLAPSKGKSRLYMGGEEFHLIPGIPDPKNNSLVPHLTHLAFLSAEAADFAGSLRTQEIITYIRQAKIQAKDLGIHLHSARSENELDELGVFLRAEFSGRWEREFRFWRSRCDTKSAFWNLMRNGNGQITGFARLAKRGGEEGGWCPGALRFPLQLGMPDQLTDSCLGPIGVAASERGKGSGKVLLGLALELLFENDADRVCIDWTNAYNYYKPLGLPAVRTYLSAWKDY